MSTTRPFNASAMGNGFPFCVIRDSLAQDFGNYKFVKFPGATNSERLQNASWFFWRLKSFSKFQLNWTMFETDRPPQANNHYIKEDPSGNVSFFPNYSEDYLSVSEPFQRVCPPRDMPGAYDYTGEPLFETVLETGYDDTYGQSGFAEIWFHFGFDEDGDICLMYDIMVYIEDNQSFTILNSESFDIAYNSATVSMQVGPKSTDTVDLLIYGLYIEGTSDYVRFDGGEIITEFWEEA